MRLISLKEKRKSSKNISKEAESHFCVTTNFNVNDFDMYEKLYGKDLKTANQLPMVPKWLEVLPLQH